MPPTNRTSLDKFDLEAEREGQAIIRANHIKARGRDVGKSRPLTAQIENPRYGGYCRKPKSKGRYAIAFATPTRVVRVQASDS